MPNWCNVHCKVSGNGENVRRMYKEMNYAAREGRYAHDWMYHLVEDILHLRYTGSTLDAKEGVIFSRGYWWNANHVDENGTDEYETWEWGYDSAWSPCISLMNLLAEHYEVDLLWYAYEPGCGVLETNDEGCEAFAANVYTLDEEGDVDDCLTGGLFDCEQDFIDCLDGEDLLPDDIGSFNDVVKYLKNNGYKVVIEDLQYTSDTRD